MQKDSEKIIYIVAEHFENIIKPVTYELAACACKIKKFYPADIRVIILGKETEKLSFEIARTTGLDVTAIEINELAFHNAQIYKDVLKELAEESHPSFVLFANTPHGLDVACGLSVRTGGACIAGVEGIDKIGETLCFRKQMFYGKINAHIAADSDTLIITVQPGTFGIYRPESQKPGSVETRKVQYSSEITPVIVKRRSESHDSPISEAKVIVSAGNGIGERENLDLIYKLAGIFPGSAVGGSRILVDRGWLEYKQQIGLTGTQVAPELYIACGISGASQHLAGMKGSGFIVAINKDKGAAIFNESDICVVEDLKTFIPALIEEYEKELKS
ncbi:MAG: electron transfer flavoprotein subunit alpha/FixB family protein [Proteobacteria bacterium]|nr:electron transfer flavoprotein subunit alpha/FixB family protein [Pseudomonadota bacterium]